MDDLSSNEQRDAPRLKRSFWIWFRPTTSVGVESWQASPLRDLTVRGARFIAERAFPIGALLDIRMRLHGNTHPLQLQARVAWSRPLAGRWGLVEHGVAFDARTTGSMKLETFVREFFDRQRGFKQQERRTRPRLIQSVRAKCRPLQPIEQPWIPLTVLNVSLKGLRVLCNQTLSAEQPLELCLALPRKTQPMVVSGRVMWCKAHASGVVEHGVGLVDLNAAQQQQMKTLMDGMVSSPQRKL